MAVAVTVAVKYLACMSMDRCNATGDHPEGGASRCHVGGVPRSGAASIAGSVVSWLCAAIVAASLSVPAGAAFGRLLVSLGVRAGP